MATVRTGREPRDIGPAAAGGGMSAMGRLSVLGVPGIEGAAQATGVGPVVRRVESRDERRAREEREVLAAVRPLPVAQPAHIVSAIRQVAADAPAPEQAPAPAPSPSLGVPCGTCLHAAVCWIKAQLEDPPALDEIAPLVAEIAPGARIVMARERVECDHYLGEQPAAKPAEVHSFSIPEPPADSEPIRREHGGEAWRTGDRHAFRGRPRKPGGKADRRDAKRDRARAVLEAMERYGGDRAAVAAELGMRAGAVTMVLRYADRNAPATSGPG